MNKRPESDTEVAAWLEDEGTVLLTVDSSSPVSGFPSNGDMSIAHGFLAGDASAELERMEQRRQRFGSGGPIQVGQLSDSDLEEFLESIKNDYAAGVTSIAKHALKKSGWKPQPGNTENIPENFIKYLQILAVDAPCFEVINEDNENELNELDLFINLETDLGPLEFSDLLDEEFHKWRLKTRKPR